MTHLGGAVPAMAFYGLTGDAWDAVPTRDRERMLETVPVFNDIAQSDTDADAVRACGRWQDRLACVEHYVEIQHEARRAVCMMEAMTVREVFCRLRTELKAGRTQVQASDPASQHPQHWALVELLQRALVLLEVHAELGASGADGLTAAQVDDVRGAARQAAQAIVAYQVPHGVVRLLLALKPAVVCGVCQ